MDYIDHGGQNLESLKIFVQVEVDEMFMWTKISDDMSINLATSEGRPSMKTVESVPSATVS